MTKHERYYLRFVEEMEQERVMFHDGKGNLFIYDERGIYVRLENDAAHRLIRDWIKKHNETELNHKWIEYIRHELSERTALYVKQFDDQVPSEFITVKNGRVDLRTGKLSDHGKNYYDTVALDFNFRENAKIEENSVTRKFLKEALGIEELDPQKSPKLKMFYQAIGYCLSNLANAKKLPILLGSPNTGKSVILKLCAKIIGEENVRALSLQDLTDKYRGGLLNNAKLVICHEIRLGNLKRLDIVKSIISGDPVTLEEKFVKAFTYVPNVKILMAANALPELGEIDAGGAFAERLLVIPFAKREGENDVELLDKLYNERDELFSAIFREMKNFIVDGFKFAETKESRSLLEEYKDYGNSLNAFLKENYEKGTRDDKVSTVRLYECYKSYCEENLLCCCSRNEFRQQLLQLGYRFKKERLNKGSNPVSCVLGLKLKGQYDNSKGAINDENINSQTGR